MVLKKEIISLINNINCSCAKEQRPSSPIEQGEVIISKGKYWLNFILGRSTWNKGFKGSSLGLISKKGTIYLREGYQKEEYPWRTSAGNNGMVCNLLQYWLMQEVKSESMWPFTYKGVKITLTIVLRLKGE